MPNLICEKCEEPNHRDDLNGCEGCGEMFGPCCSNAVNSNYCIECEAPEEDEE